MVSYCQKQIAAPSQIKSYIMSNSTRLIIAVSLIIYSASGHIISSSERAPWVREDISTCFGCLSGSNRYWCIATQKCYQYNPGFHNSIAGLDCTRPEDYTELLDWNIPNVFKFQTEMFPVCLTEYEPYPSEESRSLVTTDCAFTFDEESGEKVTG